MKPTLLKIIITIILAFILFNLSQVFNATTEPGGTSKSGFPLHYQQTQFSDPGLYAGGGEAYREINYTNLIIDILFWLVISYLLVFGLGFIFRKKK